MEDKLDSVIEKRKTERTLKVCELWGEDKREWIWWKWR